MDKASRIAAAALLAASIGYATPAFSVQTTAEAFMRSLSSDFAGGDLGGVLAKLDELKSLGFEGIMVDDEIVSLSRLLDLLAKVRAGNLDPDRVAAQLLAVLQGASEVRFIVGDIRVNSVDLGGGGGSVFPAGSAG